MDFNLRLIQSFDSLFPIGAFTLSNGMETYVQKEIVFDKDSLIGWLDSFLYVMPFNDLGFASYTMRTGNFMIADSLCCASKSPRELREGSNKLCRRFIKAQKEICSESLKLLLDYEKKIDSEECSGMYPVALGLYFKDLNLEIKDCLTLYAYSQISTLVNHAVKLIPLGQLEGQKALFDAMKKIDSVVQRAIMIDEDELGFGGYGFDLRSMEHEKLYSRLYIS